MWRKVVGGMLNWIACTIGKLNKMDRLENNDAIPLGSTIEDASNLYGEPIAIEKSDSFPDSTEYTFRMSPFHECVIWEWNGLVHSIVYFAEVSYPDPDLKFMFETYSENHSWDTVNQGYLYCRDDRLVRIWCSAMPPIGVATMEFWDAKEAYTREKKHTTESDRGITKEASQKLLELEKWSPEGR